MPLTSAQQAQATHGPQSAPHRTISAACEVWPGGTETVLEGWI